MRARSLFALVPALTCAAALAAPAQDDPLAVSAIPPSVPVTAFVVRNYADTVTLGTHVPTGVPMYPHRSARIEYAVSCAEGQIAMRGWQLYSGPDGKGQVVWGDRDYGQVALEAPQSEEERNVVAKWCAGRVSSL
jgi:hypothetical protein